MKRLIQSLMLLMLAGCATTADREAGDPLGRYNRGVWAFNDTADKILLKPVSTVYRTVTPRPARRGLSRVLDNLSEPWNAINSLLQGNPARAGRALARFAINTTLGVGGLADHATGMGVKPAPEDFGQTLGVWGVRSGPYLMLPFLGPSTFRDATGRGVAFFADPYRIALKRWSGLSQKERYAVIGFEVIDTRARLTDIGADDLLKSSLDPYATARSAFLQRRVAEIANQDDGVTMKGNATKSGDDAALDAALDDAAAAEQQSTPATSDVAAPASSGAMAPGAPATSAPVTSAPEPSTPAAAPPPSNAPPPGDPGMSGTGPEGAATSTSAPTPTAAAPPAPPSTPASEISPPR